MNTSINRSIITIAIGNNYFYNLTDNLITSFLLKNQDNDIKFNLVTDNPDYFSKHKSDKVIIQNISIPVDEKSFTAKFYLYDYAIAKNNLFIDCDCLIYKNIEPIFKELESFNFTAIGSKQTQGDFFCDIQKIITEWDIESLPQFVGSVYFFKKNEIVQSIFNKAIELKKNYDNYGFTRLRNKENEEPLFALAMALHQQEPYQGKINIKCDAMFYKSIKSNILRGNNNLKVDDRPVAEIYRNFDTDSTFIIHFNASYTDSWMYKLEEYRLRNKHSYNFLNELFGLIFIKYTSITIISIKSLFRPLFRFIFGVRKIKDTIRVQHLKSIN